VTYLLIQLIIWAVSVLILTALVAVVARRLFMGRKYAILDRERERHSGLLIALSSGAKIESEKALTARPGSPSWSAVEEFLFKGLDTPGREEAIRLFDELGYTRHYLERIRKGNRWDQALAAEKLGRIRCQRAVPHLIEALSSANKDLKLMAINSLGSIGDEAAIPHLISILKRSLKDEEEVSTRVLKSALISFGPAVLRDLLSELDNDDWKVRATVLEILCEINDMAALSEFTRKLRDCEPEVRAKAAKGLGRLGSPDAIPALLHSLDDQDWVVRLHSARALGLIGDEKALRALKETLCDRNWQVRAAASEAMAGIGASGCLELLRVYIEESDQYAREQALDELLRADIYSRVAGLLEREDILKDHGKTADMGKGEDPVVQIAGMLSTLGPDKLREALSSISGKGAGDEDAIFKVCKSLKENQSRFSGAGSQGN